MKFRGSRTRRKHITASCDKHKEDWCGIEIVEFSSSCRKSGCVSSLEFMDECNIADYQEENPNFGLPFLRYLWGSILLSVGYVHTYATIQFD